MARRQSYTKDLKINVDTTELKELKQQLDLLQQEKLEIASKKLLELDKDDPTNLEEIAKLKEQIKEFTEEMEEVDFKKSTSEFKKKLKELGEDMVDSIKDFFEDVFKAALDRIQDMASYDLANTRVFNREAYDQAMRYGITDPSQNYALAKAMEDFNLRSEEDIMVGAYDREAFAKQIGYYTDQYKQLSDKDFFRTVQDFTFEWQQFKHELEFSLIEFFMENKEAIKTTLRLGIKFMGYVMTALDGILKFMRIGRTEDEKQSALSNIVNQYSNLSEVNTSSQKVYNNNININNNVESSQLLGDKGILDRANKTTHAQLIKILKEE